MFSRATSIVRVVPPLAHVLGPALSVRALSTTAALNAGAARFPRSPNKHNAGVVNKTQHLQATSGSASAGASRAPRWPKKPNASTGSQPPRQRGADARASAPAQQTTSRRLAAVPRTKSPGRKPAEDDTVKETGPLAQRRGHDNVLLAQGKPFASFDKLHPGLTASLEDKYPGGKTTPIQSLALAKLLDKTVKPRHAVLGAETGSGKTLAYLLPLMHHLKATDTGRPTTRPDADTVTVSPRALVLSPTHELTRQSTTVAKGLTHNAKLSVAGASSPGSVRGLGPVDVLFATGRSAASLLAIPREDKADRGKPADTPTRRFEPEKLLDLDRLEWLVIDEADVLLGPDFVDETSTVLERIRSAAPNAHVLLVTATLPPSLLRVLESKVFGRAEFEHLLSPGLHRLPRKLDTRFVAWSGSGNRLADVVHEIKRGFAEDAQDAKLAGVELRPKAVVFCGSVGQVKAVTKVLEEKQVPALAWTGESAERNERPGHNGPLDSFLVQHGRKPAAADTKAPRVLVTTSLLSRGLDFSPDVTTSYLLDPPRDVLDFVHRAGRAGRAGRPGRVVVFGLRGANEMKYAKELKNVLGKTETRAAVKPGGRTWSKAPRRR